MRKTLTFALMDPPYENPRSTALRLIDCALRDGYNVNVFAYEGAVSLAFVKQIPHANAMHGRDAAQEDHPNPKDWIAALQKQAEQKGLKLDWVQCGLCVDERGAGESIPGLRRGSPADFWKFLQESDNTRWRSRLDEEASMARRVLSIIESAYRATLEEQDDTIIWLSYTLRTAGAELDVLLRGNAVNYAVAGQDASGLAFGERRQTRVDADVLKLIGQGAQMLVVAEDLAERGITPGELVAGIKTVKRSALSELCDSYDQVWHW